MRSIMISALLMFATPSAFAVGNWYRDNYGEYQCQIQYNNGNPTGQYCSCGGNPNSGGSSNCNSNGSCSCPGVAGGGSVIFKPNTLAPVKK